MYKHKETEGEGRVRKGKKGKGIEGVQEKGRKGREKKRGM